MRGTVVLSFCVAEADSVTAVHCAPGLPGRRPVDRTAPAALHTVGPSHIVVTAVVRDASSLYTYLGGPLGRLEGVQHVETTPLLRRVKQLTYQRPPR
ncbi:hypothetical protein [Streptomyces sp. NPDC048710]|uniref:hypothetical protein n=1 Tax=unclassified Streptomyces TaxID=2593676 RepID=UPI003722DAAA